MSPENERTASWETCVHLAERPEESGHRSTREYKKDPGLRPFCVASVVSRPFSGRSDRDRDRLVQRRQVQATALHQPRPPVAVGNAARAARPVAGV